MTETIQHQHALYEGLLFALFDHLRRNQFPLGVDDYTLALKTLRNGYGLQSLAAMQLTLQLLWIKSAEDLPTFDGLFQHFIAIPLQRQSQSRSVYKDVKSPLPKSDYLRDASNQPADSKYRSNQPKIDRNKTTKKQIEEQLPVPSGLKRQPYGSDYLQQPFQMRVRPPLTQREMAQIWRLLHKPQRTGALLELDVKATLANFARDGLLQAPVFQARRRNQARLIVLVDKSNAMMSFRILTNTIFACFRSSSLQGRTTFFYFQEIPHNIFATTPNLMQSISLHDMLSVYIQDASVLIIGDAGAARRIHQSSWVTKTADFVQQLRQYTHLYAWLNPLPRERWGGSSAEKIATHLPIYPVNREGLIDTVNILRGHPFPSEVSLNAHV